MNPENIRLLKQVVNDKVFMKLMSVEENIQKELGYEPEDFITGFLLGWKLRKLYEKENEGISDD